MYNFEFIYQYYSNHTFVRAFSSFNFNLKHFASISSKCSANIILRAGYINGNLCKIFGAICDNNKTLNSYRL